MAAAAVGDISQGDREALIDACMEATELSYAKYSNYKVGAALLILELEDGGLRQSSCGSSRNIVLGCNVENGSYPDGCCAEKCAIVKAVSQGHRRFRALAVTIATDGDDYPRMCGSCRQVLAEFCGDEFPVFLVRYQDRHWKMVRLGDYLPDAFRGEHAAARTAAK